MSGVIEIISQNVAPLILYIVLCVVNITRIVIDIFNFIVYGMLLVFLYTNKTVTFVH